MSGVTPCVDGLLAAECERARAQASLALDCELSELERAHLRSHLAGCEACAAFVAGLREVTHELRAAPLPVPSRPLVPRTHRARRLPVVVAAIAVLVAAAAAGGVAGSLRSEGAPTSVTAKGAGLARLFAARPETLPGSRLPQQTAI